MMCPRSWNLLLLLSLPTTRALAMLLAPTCSGDEPQGASSHARFRGASSLWEFASVPRRGRGARMCERTRSCRAGPARAGCPGPAPGQGCGCERPAGLCLRLEQVHQRPHGVFHLFCVDRSIHPNAACWPISCRTEALRQIPGVVLGVAVWAVCHPSTAAVGDPLNAWLPFLKH